MKYGLGLNGILIMSKVSTYDKVDAPVRGEKYHVKWAESKLGNPYAFRLVDYGMSHAILKADSRKKHVTCKLSELQHTNSSAKKANRAIIEFKTLESEDNLFYIYNQNNEESYRIEINKSSGDRLLFINKIFCPCGKEINSIDSPVRISHGMNYTLNCTCGKNLIKI